MKNKFFRIVDTAHYFLAEKLSQSHNLLDATAGNGHDTLFLAQNSPVDAVVWFFDIQQQSIDKTINVLAEADLAFKGRPVNACHTKVAEYIDEPLDIAMFNLGYLPGGSHILTTKATTSLTAIQAVLEMLAPGGLLSIVAYPGHSEGYIEQQQVCEYLRGLPSTKFTSASWKLINQENKPPVLYIVEKK
ncbi:MAG: rRNA methylase [Firmicutes bacterium]|nr:rRNA methylase [Bacillota bacterium]